MRGYSVLGSNATGTANKTMVNVIATAAVRPGIFEAIVGCAATPADQAGNFAIGRTTANGTAGSNPTPQSLDSADVASITTAGAAHSAEPTYTAGAKLLSFSMNQRATFRWVAVPGYELISPATASNGMGFYLVSATASTVFDGTLYFKE